MASRKHMVLEKLSLIFLGALLFSGLRSASEGMAFVQSTTANGTGLAWSTPQATLNLQLECPPAPLTNWGPCWDDAAVDAAAHWTSSAAQFQFFPQSPPVTATPCSHTDGLNTAAFSLTLCNMAFGASVVAVTVQVFNSSTGALLNTDVLFNAARQWSTYPGPLQLGVIDFHRVAIHEFGHVLGLGHPDQAGQSVPAIMNSTVSDIDALQPDDLAGVNAIYPALGPPTGALENPEQESFVSGISTISGWVCNASRVDVQIDGVSTQAAYGTSRADTVSVCGDEDNGFGILFNWNLLVDGPHTLVAFADGVEFARAVFTVTSLGQEFVTGASGVCQVPDFAGHNVTLQWQESLQNFSIVGVQ